LYHSSGNLQITGTSEDRFANTPRRPFSELRPVSRRWRIKCLFFNQFIVQSRPSHSCHSCFIAYNKRHHPVPSSPTDAESHNHLPQAGRYTQVTRTATDPHMTLVTGLWLRKTPHFLAPTDDELFSHLRACSVSEILHCQQVKLQTVSETIVRVQVRNTTTHSVCNAYHQAVLLCETDDRTYRNGHQSELKFSKRSRVLKFAGHRRL